MKDTKLFLRKFILFIVIFCAIFIISEQFFRPNITLDLSVNTVCNLDVFYDNCSVDGYCFDATHLAETSKLKLGRQTVTIYVPRDGLNRLRIDFGNKPCKVELYSLSVVPDKFTVRSYSAEDIFHSFNILNDISLCDYKDGVAVYTVSGGDGHIAALDPLPVGSEKINIGGLVLWILLHLGVPTFVVTIDSVLPHLKRIVIKHPRFWGYLLVIISFETIALALCPEYWLLITASSVCFGCGVCYTAEYLFEDRTLIRDYIGITLVSLIGLMPLFLNGFYYGDSYWSRALGKTAQEHLSLLLGMKRPFVGLFVVLFADISVEYSYIMRMWVAAGLVFSGLLLYRFVNHKLKSKLIAFILSISMCASTVAVDCLAYLDIFPIAYSLLFSIISYVAWDRLVCKKNIALNATVFTTALLAAFNMYQIGTPIFFVLLLISVLSEKEQDRCVLKKGVAAVFSYGVVAVVYLFCSSCFQNLYHVANMQSERSQFVHTIPEIIEKLIWFFTIDIPQAIHKIWATILPGSLHTTNNLFYSVAYKEDFWEIVLITLFVMIISIFLGKLLSRKQWQKAIGCLCALFLSSYPFLILPESTVLTYYMLPLIVLLEVFLVLGLIEAIRWVNRFLKSKWNIRKCEIRQFAILAVTFLVAMNSVKYANYWAMYCRDSYQYIKQYILSNMTEDTTAVHVYGTISPYVGSGPYPVGAVQRAFEEIGVDPSQYRVTQSDTPYTINQLTAENAQAAYEALSNQDYNQFMSYYKYSIYYDTYYLVTNSFDLEEQKFLQKCLKQVGLIPDGDDVSTLIISLSGFNQLHSF